MIKTILKPADFIRYTEFGHFIKIIKQNKIQSNSPVLDISSPYLMAYYLAKQHLVTKTDINIAEKSNIKDSTTLHFEHIDGTNMPYSDHTFDMTYSISVVEHIYQNYTLAIKEMIRVTKPKGLIYLSFPVSATHVEEWLEKDIYSNQTTVNNKVFFQYRFCERDVITFKEQLGNTVEVLNEDIFWEKNNGYYNRVISKMQKANKLGVVGFFINCIYNTCYGFTCLKSTSHFSIKPSLHFLAYRKLLNLLYLDFSCSFLPLQMKWQG